MFLSVVTVPERAARSMTPTAPNHNNYGNLTVHKSKLPKEAKAALLSTPYRIHSNYRNPLSMLCDELPVVGWLISWLEEEHNDEPTKEEGEGAARRIC